MRKEDGMRSYIWTKLCLWFSCFISPEWVFDLPTVCN